MTQNVLVELAGRLPWRDTFGGTVFPVREVSPSDRVCNMGIFTQVQTCPYCKQLLLMAGFDIHTNKQYHDLCRGAGIPCRTGVQWRHPEV